MIQDERDAAIENAAMLIGDANATDPMEIARAILAPFFAKIRELEEENADLHTRFSRLLCHATGGELSKTNYLSETMEAAVTDYINKEREEAFAEGRQEALEETGAKIAEVEFARDVAQRDADNSYKRLNAEIAKGKT